MPAAALVPLTLGRLPQLAETKLKVDTVERERDFYFDKLRDIEILCQMPELQSVPVRIGHPCSTLMQAPAPACPELCMGILGDRHARRASIAALHQAAAPADATGGPQVVKYFEQILYATDETEAKECMLEAQKLYAGANGHATK